MADQGRPAERGGEVADGRAAGDLPDLLLGERLQQRLADLEVLDAGLVDRELVDERGRVLTHQRHQVRVSGHLRQEFRRHVGEERHGRGVAAVGGDQALVLGQALIAELELVGVRVLVVQRIGLGLPGLVAHQRHRLVDLARGDLVGPGGEGALVVLGAGVLALLHRGPAGQREGERQVGLLRRQLQHDGLGVRGADRVQRLAVVGAGVDLAEIGPAGEPLLHVHRALAVVLLEGALEAVLDVGGGDRRAVLPRHAVAQRVGPGLAAVLGDAGVGGQVADQRHLAVALPVAGQRPGDQVGDEVVGGDVDPRRVQVGEVDVVEDPHRAAGDRALDRGSRADGTVVHAKGERGDVALGLVRVRIRVVVTAAPAGGQRQHQREGERAEGAAGACHGDLRAGGVTARQNGSDWTLGPPQTPSKHLNVSD